MQEPKEIIGRIKDEPAELERPFDNRYTGPGRYPSYAGEAAMGFRFADYWHAIRKRLWLVAGLTVLATTLTAVYMARKPNIYASRAVVQVDLEQVNPELITSDRIRPISNPDPAYFNTQLQLLKSDGLLRRVIKENNLDTNEAFLLAKEEGTSISLGSLLRSIGLATSDANKKQDASGLPTLDGLASPEEIEEAVKLAPYVDLIKRNLDVEPVRETRSSVRDTRLIDITFRHPNAEIAAFVANAIAGTFTALNQEKRTGTSRKTNDFLQERIANLQADIKRDEERLVELTQNAGILKTEGEQTIVLDRLSGLNKQLLEAENQRKLAEANYLAVANSPERLNALVEEQSARFITEQENNIRAFRSEILKKMADLRQIRAAKLQDFQEGAPEIREIDSQLKSYEDSIDKAVAKFQSDLDQYRKRTARGTLENLRTKYLQAKGQEDKIRADFDRQYNEAQAQNQSAVNIKLLQQNIDTNKGFLDNLRKQVSGNDVAAQGSDNNISVIEIALPSGIAVSPRRLMSVAFAFLLSTMFGIGLALFLEYLDDTIRSAEEIETYLQLPALATIPVVDALPKRKLLLVGNPDPDAEPVDSPLLISADPRSALSEAYRHLRTSILLSSAGHAPKMLLITSSLPAEGKTTTATNTAISLAQTGAKVLIIDADMRRPRVHSIFGMPNTNGLSNLLANELSDRDLDAAILYDKSTRLFVMPSGPIPPNPAELIGSEQMAHLLEMLRTRFTHVVLDSPPIASFTDGVLIASMVDGVILVVHAGVSSRQVVRKARVLLNEIGAKVFGVVLNRVSLDAKHNYYYYQTYYHKNTYPDSDES